MFSDTTGSFVSHVASLTKMLIHTTCKIVSYKPERAWTPVVSYELAAVIWGNRQSNNSVFTPYYTMHAQAHVCIIHQLTCEVKTVNKVVDEESQQRLIV